MTEEAREACGVVGIYAPGEDVARLSYYALYALQHRGQESAGIAISDGQTIVVYKDLGLVAQVFDETVLKSLRGHVAIGHTRYSTTGSTSWENAQPTYKSSPAGQLALAHNGNLVNSVDLKRSLREAGGDPTPEAARLPSSSDTDLVAVHIARANQSDTRSAIVSVLPRLSGAYSFTMMDAGRLFGARDPYGFRPLSIGRLEAGGWVLSSERFARAQHASCIFEPVSFPRPDSTLMGQNVYATRYRMGQRLAQE